MSRALARLVGLAALWAGVELLERVAYAAGVDEAAAEASTTFAGLRVAVVDLTDVDEDLAAVDVSDVVEAHAGCCGTPA